MSPNLAAGYFACQLRCREKKFDCTSLWATPDHMVSLVKGRDPPMP